MVPTPLEVRDLSRRFGGLAAVDALSLSVGPGEIVGLIGPNGAGKSTTINLISGLLAATTGSVHVGGHDVTRADAHTIAHLGLARTFQTSRLFTDVTVEKNIELARLFLAGGTPAGSPRRWLSRILGLPSADVRTDVERLLERLGLTAIRRTPAKMLSYGHQRRLEIARALALCPGVLLLDEPVAGMNDREALAIGELLTELAGEGLAILLVEHNMRFVADTAKRLYVLDHGSLIADGVPGDVLARPIVVEAYLGTSHAHR